MFQVPYKILCKVVNVELKAETETDEVFAQITLQPDPDQENLPSLPDPPLPELSRPVVHSFCKILTPSDTSTHGGFSVLRRHANECLPPLDISMPTPAQELIAKDLHGSEWRFKHIYRGQPRRHLLTTGWSTFVTSKKLIAGDAFVYLRSETGEQRVGVRRLVQKQSTMPASVMSSQSMHLGVLASASHAIKTNSIFLVYYRPRLSQSQYIVSVNKYLAASKIGFNVGMTFKMSFEGEDVPVKKFSGTIVGDGDLSPQWSGSEWKSLKVQWDDVANVSGPGRVSPWEIESCDGTAPTINVPLQSSTKNKRPRQPSESLDLQSLEPAQEFWLSGVPQQHEKICIGSSDLTCISGHQVVWPSEHHHPGKGVSASLSEISLKLFQGTNNEARLTPWPVLPVCQAEELTSKLSSNTALGVYRTEEVAPNVSKVVEEKMEPGKFRLFGVNLMKCTSTTVTADKSGGVTGETSTRAAGSVSYEDSGHLSTFSKVTKDRNIVDESHREIQSHQSYTGRTQIKVQMHGNALVRAVDLSNLDGYEKLMNGLEEMFNIKDLKEKWNVAFTDDEGDTMEVGDDPWLEFCQMARKIVLYPIVDDKIEEQDQKTEI
ncbi:hypothetical protein GUJ93_ZPchr0001g30339 [Zizania palustris]|nr:hypothetical protein GUJ93_ZPchr0001g30339 [Zizania palustris]KAG8052497.1 hypothetical protein GUJ93_ZPchr0001g30339 [Zizania palustris]